MPACFRTAVRRLATHAGPAQKSEAYFFVDSVFPIRLGKWDLRHYVGLLREGYLLDKLRSHLESVHTRGFRVLSLEPRHKDGGVFVRFQYLEDDSNQALDDILTQTRHVISEYNGFPSWMGGRQGGNAWLVKGTPWKEDMDRFASSMLKVTFEGPDVHEQSLFQTFRPFGRIRDIASPGVVPSGVPRTSTIIYDRLKSAVIARNVIYGFEDHFDSPSMPRTRLYTEYQKPIQVHIIRNWISSHPKIVMPLVVFLLGALTYTIFDPLRSLLIQARILRTFDYREFGFFKWLQKQTFDRFPPLTTGEDALSGIDAWKERKEAEASLKKYLSDVPNTIAFLYGPQGSGKHRMIETTLRETGRNALVIDCAQLSQMTSDAQLIGSLAAQTGYRPVFTFLNSITTLIDVASIGLIGQKTGFSSSLPDQLRQILRTTTAALEQIVIRRRKHVEEKAKGIKLRQQSKAEGADGNQILPQGQVEGVVTMEGLPVVIISHFSSRVGSHRQEIPEILAEWAANLVEKQIAHVLVISDNRENAKQAAKALPTKPLYVIQLRDADTMSSLLFVKRKLQSIGINLEFTQEQAAHVERLGGRASDLELLVHKIRNGQQVEDAVEEIVNRGVNELRKKAFGEDEEEAKRLPWTREQAWKIVKLLSEQSEIPYYDVLYNVPFSGEESSLREMERAEIISIRTLEGRPSTIKPGRPILKWVFSRLASDSIFAAIEQISYNSKLISNYEKTIRSGEEELIGLRQVLETQTSGWFFTTYDGGLRSRARYTATKINAAQKQLEALENANRELKMILAKGDKK
ncbi:RNA12 protein-domain-containing protein [Amanita rubescens]|nr:RNA12 protein-domain-containing protein [Amanita rubescens]